MLARLLCLAAASAWSAAWAQPAPNGFYVENVTADEALFYPTDIALAPDGTAYVAHKQGWISVVDRDGTVRAERFLDIQPEVHSAGDRGLLGIALDPGFPAEPYLYLFYMRRDTTSNHLGTPFTFGRLERVTAAGPDLAVAAPDSRVVLLGESYADGPLGCEPFHAGATVAFAPDGSLLLSTGDAAYPGTPVDVGGRLPECFAPGRADPANDVGAFRAQRLESLNGKLLRLDAATGQGLPDNPFWTGDGDDAASKVWALGLRNPFRFDIRPDADGGFLVAVGDVGWYTFEEVNLARGGENFGWPCLEGGEPQDLFVAAAPAACDALDDAVGPAARWHHTHPERSIPAGLTARSVTGGAFYDGGAFPEAYDGALFVADFASEWLMALHFQDGAVVSAERVLESVGAIVDVEVDPTDGSLLLLDILGGRILRMLNTGAGDAAPVARGEATPASGEAPLPVTFSAQESFDPSGGEVAVSWSFGDGAEGEGPVVEHVYNAPGAYTATLTVTAASGRATQTTLPVVVGVSMPRVAILSPAPSQVVEGAQVALLAEAADDAEPADDLAVRWEARIVHNGHEHPGVFTAEGPAATLPIVPHGSAEELTYYTVTATVEDGEGLAAEASVALPVVAPGTVVGRVAPAWEGGVVELGEPVALRGLAFSGSLAADEVAAVEVREGGAWRAPSFAQGVPAAGETLVLFVEAQADAVRVGEASGAPELVVALGTDADAAGLDLATLGAAEPAGALAADASGLALQVDGGELPTVAYRALGGANSAETEVRAGLGSGRAGLALLPSLDPAAGRIELTVDGAGGVVLREAAGTVRQLLQAELPARVRLSEAAGDAVAELWTGGAWSELVRTPYGGGGFAALVAQSPSAFAARFDGLAVGAVGVSPPAIASLAVEAVAPNPSSGDAVASVAVPAAGAYRADVFDALGRRVWSAGWSSPESRVETVPLPLGRLAPGAYALRVHHLDTGATALVRLTRVR